MGWIPFALALGGGLLNRHQQNRQARRQYESARNDPRRFTRNAVLRQLWNEHGLADRFKDAFPDPSKLAPGTSAKTPENVLRAKMEEGLPERPDNGGWGGLASVFMNALQFAPKPKPKQGMELPEPFDGEGGGYSPGSYAPRG